MVIDKSSKNLIGTIFKNFVPLGLILLLGICKYQFFIKSRIKDLNSDADFSYNCFCLSLLILPMVKRTWLLKI